MGLISDAIDFNKERVLLPMGWAPLSEGEVGHHCLFLIEKERGKKNERVISVFDNASIDDSNQLADGSIPTPRISTRECVKKYRVANFQNKTALLAESIMLQIPVFAAEFQNFMMKSELSETTVASTERNYYSKIFYPISGSSQIKSEKKSPLDRWDGGDQDSCAFSTFLPLMQTLAKNKIVNDGIILSPAEETDLQVVFRILLKNYKLFLLDHILIPQHSIPDLDISEKEICELDSLKSFLISSINIDWASSSRIGRSDQLNTGMAHDILGLS